MTQENMDFGTEEAQQRFAGLPEKEQERIVGQQQVEAGIVHDRVRDQVDSMSIDAQLAEIADRADAQRIRGDIHELVSQEIGRTDEALSAFVDAVRAGVKAVTEEAPRYKFEVAEPQCVDYLAASLEKTPFRFAGTVQEDQRSVLFHCVELGAVRNRPLVVMARKGEATVELMHSEHLAILKGRALQ